MGRSSPANLCQAGQWPVAPFGSTKQRQRSTKLPVDWYFERSQMAASKFAAELSRAIEKIAEAPERWPSHILNTRRYLLYRFPYAVVYRKLPSTKIQILAVAHTHRRPGYWKKRTVDDQ